MYMKIWEIKKVKGKVFHIDTMTAHRESGDIVPLILNLGTRWG
jgi:hypothetical protein